MNTIERLLEMQKDHLESQREQHQRWAEEDRQRDKDSQRTLRIWYVAIVIGFCVLNGTLTFCLQYFL